MPKSLEGVLASIPGYAGYLAKQRFDEQSTGAEIGQMSSLLALKQHLDEQAREQGFRQGFRPDMTPEELVGLSARFAKPGDVLKTQQGHLDRQAGIEAARINAQATREAKAAELQARLADQRLNTQERNALMLEIAKLRTTASQEKPPPGFRKSADGNLEAIPGGPADTKLTGAFNADTANLESSTAGLNRMMTAANELLNHPGLKSITGLRGSIPNMPGSAAADAQAKLENLKSQVGFSVLQSMRDASKTGGALGNVSDAEGKRLEANLAALQNAQSLQQFQKELKAIIQFTNEAKDRLRGAYNLKHKERLPDAPGGPATPPAPAPGAGAPPAAASPVDALLEKYK